MFTLLNVRNVEGQGYGSRQQGALRNSYCFFVGGGWGVGESLLLQKIE